MQEYKLWIGGKWISPESGKTFPTFNPTTGEEIAQIPFAGQTEVDMAVEAARKAFPSWSQLKQVERSQIMGRIAASIRKNAEEFTRLEILEAGSGVEFANMVPKMAVMRFESAGSIAKSLISDYIPGMPDTVTYTRREPIGVAGLITPWNHALGMMIDKVSSALSVGCTCVLKPPSVNSLIGLKLAEVLEQADLPQGVVNIVTGSGTITGNAIASHPGVDVIGFTGSCETGKAIMAAASGTIKRINMELGGNNPVILLRDANLDEAIKPIVLWQYDKAGQHCSGAGRYYVHKDIYEQFLNKFVEESKKIIVGDPADKKTFMGPLAMREQRDRVEEYIKSGVAQGATLLLGGTRSTEPPMSKGWFVMPTVFANVKQNMKIAREEIFGPVAVIMEPFASEDEVIELANDTGYGLAASVFTKDTARGMTFISKLHAGTVCVNRIPPVPGLPWEGFKESGIGDGSALGYTQVKAVAVKIN